MTSRISSRLICGFILLLLLNILQPRTLGQANVQGQWSTLQYSMPINPVHVALLGNGKVLVVAGSGNCPPSQAGCPSGPPYGPSNNSGALLFDPSSGAITQFSVSWDMFCNGMVLLDDGRALIDGGSIQYDPFDGQPQVALFDPGTNAFTNIQNMAHGRWYPTVLTLGDGRVMTFSGLNETGGTNTAVEFYTVGSGWSQQYPASWTPDLYPRLHLVPSGKVFYSGAQTTSKMFDPLTTTWNTNFATTNYSNSRTYGTSVLLPLSPTNNYDPRVIIMGGSSPATATTEIIDLGAASPAWQYGPSMSQARIEMNAVILPNGKVLALGGSVNDEDSASLSLNADLYDPATNAFSSAGANASQRLYHSVALLLPDATVWVAGGNPSRGTYNNTIEIYQPAYLFNTDGTLATRPSITSAPSSISYGNTFNVQTPDAANIADVVLVRNGTVTHAFGTDQREVEMSFTANSGAVTVMAPPNGNIAPPGYYMLFLLNSAGVPSLAKFVQITSGPPDFAIAASPSSQTVSPGNVTTYNVSVSASNGVNGSVSFSISGLPSSATGSFSPSLVQGSGSSTLSITTSSATPTGSYPLTITGTSGTLTHSTQVTLEVADFSISVSPSSQTVRRRSKTTYSATIAPLGPFSASVSFSVKGLPAATSFSFNPTSVAGSGTSTLTISPKRNAPMGTYGLTVTGIGGGAQHSANVTLVVQ
ncbi:MAG TPA: galactose oxidase-like domain-containing protein [Candidatus Sulfotelmatobacter sp.]|jgi:hypothetical protein|nr:galactose oxidase-like domain-containing protein [Candidatus Sulfotelmatobacter sp.]